MSCGGTSCPVADNSYSGDQNKGRKQKSRTLDTASNVGGSCNTSDMPNCDDCICERENLDDCCGPPAGRTCGAGTTCPTGGNSARGGSSQAPRSSTQQYNGSQGQQRKSSAYGQQQRMGGGYMGAPTQNRNNGVYTPTQNRVSGQGPSLSGPGSEPRKSNCACGPPPSENKQSTQRRTTNDNFGSYGGNTQYKSSYQAKAPGMVNQTPSFNQRVSMSQQQPKVTIPLNQYTENGGNSKNGGYEQPKQIIAPCCFPNKSAMSLSDRSSQRLMPDVSKTSVCPCNNDFPKPTEEPEDFVCPSCAEFEHPVDSYEPVPAPPPKAPSSCGEEPPANTNDEYSVPVVEDLPCQSDPEPDDCEDDTPRKKNGRGFWQQLQFQVFQQQDGEDDDNAQSSQEPCTCGSDIAEKPKKSGRVWQQLTLDIFQSKDDDEADENDSKQGWKQQLKLQIFQEKCGGDDEQQSDSAPVNDVCDECTC